LEWEFEGDFFAKSGTMIPPSDKTKWSPIYC
jgi:hypothetical protein